MSHSHVRVPRQNAGRKYRFEAVIFAVAIVLGGFYVHSRLWPHPVDQSHETATGKVLETRLVVVGTKENSYGGFILYRIEAHVTYPVNGHTQDRWMPASEVSGDRNFLALLMVKQTGKCTVYWSLHHEQNPMCLLQ